jgi:hypothetical protein
MKEEIKEIIIQRIENKDEYFASYKSEFFQSTFTLFFNDNLFGAVALNRFFEMIRTGFNLKNLVLTISFDTIRFKNKMILEELVRIKNDQPVKSEVIQ